MREGKGCYRRMVGGKVAAPLPLCGTLLLKRAEAFNLAYAVVCKLAGKRFMYDNIECVIIESYRKLNFAPFFAGVRLQIKKKPH